MMYVIDKNKQNMLHFDVSKHLMEMNLKLTWLIVSLQMNFIPLTM